jgi:hypothetical protein
MSAYTSSKFAMRGWTDALRLELLPDGIQVSLVEPGAIATDIWEKGVSAGRQLESELPARLRERYGASVEALRLASEQTSRRAIPADAAAQVIERALTAKRPKAKYLVGLDARVQAAFAELLPDRVFDATLSRMLGLPARFRTARPRPVTQPCDHHPQMFHAHKVADHPRAISREARRIGGDQKSVAIQRREGIRPRPPRCEQ